MDVGCLIRDLRLAKGWSQVTLAGELCRSAGQATVTREDVSRWENGRRAPGAFWLRHLAAALDVDVQVLEGSEVRRREFLTRVMAPAIAQLAAADLIHSGFSAALRGPLPSVDGWAETLEAYGRDYMSLGAAEMQRRLSGDLLVLQQQLEQPALWGVAARLMTLYGKTIPGTDGAKAVQWYRMAAAAADRSGDLATRVWVRGRAAIALGYEGAGLGMAETFADQAVALSEQPSLGKLNALMGKAHVAALRGDAATALRLHAEGRRVFEVAGSHEQSSDYAVPEWRMAVFESLLMARLGEERRAVRAQAVAARTLPATLPRFATHLELHQGLMLARSGDREGGLGHARSALAALPPERHSLTLRLLVSEVERQAA